MQVSRLDIERELRSRFALYSPYAKQKAFHNSVAPGKIISGGNQGLPGNTRILTELPERIAAWKEIKDVKVGDIIYDGSGNRCIVEEVSSWVGLDLYRLDFEDGRSIICDSVHNWAAKIGNSHYGNKRRGYERYSMSEIVRRCGLGKLSSRPGNCLHIPQVGLLDFPARDLPMDPYLFGHYLGNGWCNSNDSKKDYCIRISCDRDCYEMLDHLYVCSDFYENTKTFRVHCQRAAYNWLRSIGCHGSHNKFIPAEYKLSSYEQRRELFMGLMDSDGSCEAPYGRVRYSTVSEHLADDIIDLARSLGCRAKKSVRTRPNPFNKSVMCTCYTVSMLCPFNPFRLERRGKNWRGDYRHKDSLMVKNIEKVGSGGRTYCLRASSPEHTFVAENFIVTHNCGKSIAGTHEVAFHATGIYPEWYEGWRLESRIDVVTGRRVCNIIVAAPDSKTLRDSIMKKIVGSEFHEWTDGLIARKYMVDGSFIKSRGVPGLLDNVQVRRVDGSICTVYFRSYEQGRENLQSITADYVYCDEEPPQDVYAELMARLTATMGHFAMAFTPLKGLTPLVQEYWNQDDSSKELFCMSIYEVDHIAKDPAKIAQIKSNYSGLSESEREARMMGIPAMGSGTVYPVSDEVLKCDAFSIPSSWKRVAGLDFGRGDHPIACVWLAFSPEGVCYVYDLFKLTRVGDAEIASQILSRGKWIPVAWPHDFVRSSGISTVGDITKTEGWKYKDIYEKYGIEFTDCNAKTEEGSTRVEAGLVEVRQAMVEGRFRVFSHLSEWFKEKATYLYKEDGSVTKVNDDILDATRYGFIMRRYAVSEFEASGGYDDWYGRDMNKAIDDTLERD